jgi:hypothetical protein
LLKRIVCNGNQTVNVTALFKYYSFDVMGDLAFGRSFNMLRDGAAHKYMKSSHDNMLTATAFSHLVWIFPIVKKIPGLNYGHSAAEVAYRTGEAKTGEPPDNAGYFLLASERV